MYHDTDSCNHFKCMIQKCLHLSGTTQCHAIHVKKNNFVLTKCKVSVVEYWPEVQCNKSHYWVQNDQRPKFSTQFQATEMLWNWPYWHKIIESEAKVLKTC